jgi:hypothetical protein
MIKKIVEVYKENQALVICGALAMNGSANVHQTYVLLSR